MNPLTTMEVLAEMDWVHRGARVQLHVMVFLLTHRNEPTARASFSAPGCPLANYTPSSAHNVLNILCGRGLVETVPNPKRAKGVLFRLTEKGAAFLARLEITEDLLNNQ